MRSPPSRGVRIETAFQIFRKAFSPSPPSRGVRIETRPIPIHGTGDDIAPLTGGAD